MNEDSTAIQEFKGQARIFPLPGLVFFPHAVQPLHIFEPRYRQMTAEALDDDRLIALVLLKPGWEDTYDDRPAVHSVACLGRVIAEQLMPDGRYNLVLRGLARIRIREENVTDKLFRIVQADVMHDDVPNDIGELMALRTALADLILPRIIAEPAREQLRGLFQGELPLGNLCDVLAFALPLPPEVKQELLETLQIADRARELMEAFRAIVGGSAHPVATESAKRFPPDFSEN
jgi:Lon protease-like protein